MKVEFLSIILISVIVFAANAQQDTTLLLNEVTITGEKVQCNKIAPNTSLILYNEITGETYNKEITDILSQKPGVYTSSGEGIGDDNIYIRGFNQEEIQLLIDNMPEGYIDGGSVYWSNFIGIEDFIRTLEIQKGLNSIHPFVRAGGQININMFNAKEQKIVRVNQTYSALKGNKSHILYSSGLLQNGWAFAIGGTYLSGCAYKDATGIKGGNYFLNVSKTFSDKHYIELTIFGNKQSHNQVDAYQAYNEAIRNGSKFNPSWGYFNNQEKSASINFYHRRFAQLNQNLSISDKLSLNNLVFFDSGNGGGTRSFGAALPRDTNLQIDFDEAVYQNIANADSGPSAEYFLGNYRHMNSSIGINSILTYKFNETNKLDIGIFGKKSLTIQDFAEIEDLLGAEFVFDQSNSNEPNRFLVVGDRLWYNSLKHCSYYGTHFIYEKTFNFISLAFAGSFSRTATRLINYFSLIDTDGQASDMVWQNGYNFRVAASKNLEKDVDLYIVGAYQQKTNPFYLLGKTTVTNFEPQQFYNTEIGIKKTNEKTFLHVSAYYAKRINETFTNEYTDLSIGERFLYSVKGLNSDYLGVEGEYEQSFIRGKLKIQATVAYNLALYKSNIESVVTDQSGNPLDTIIATFDGIFAGGQPQLSIGIISTYKISKHFMVSAYLSYTDFQYATIIPTEYLGTANNHQPAKIPAYSLLDFKAQYQIKIKNKYRVTLSASVHNVLNEKFVVRAYDTPSHSLDNTQVILGHGRCFSASMALGF